MAQARRELTPGQKIWLSVEILNWPVSIHEWRGSSSNWKSHYDPWRHANEMLSKDDATEQHRAAAIFQLRRAVEFRETALRSVYNLNDIPGTKRETALTDLGIVLPMMREQLRLLRNKVTHVQSTAIPDARRCQEFAEFTFYFLRSTDRLLDIIPIALEFSGPNDNTSDFVLRIDPKSWRTSLAGRFDEQLVSEKRTDQGIEVTVRKGEISDHTLYLQSKGSGGDESLCEMDEQTKVRLLKTYFETNFS